MDRIGSTISLNYLQKELQRIHSMGCELIYCDTNSQSITEVLKGCAYIIAGGEYYDRDMLQTLAQNGLKLIVRMGVGYDHIDIEAASEFGIVIANSPGANAQSVAEHAFALTLAAARQIGRCNSDLHNGIWKLPVIKDLHGSTLGLIGFGNIAKRYASLIHPLVGKILAYDIYFDKIAGERLGVEYAELSSIYREADIISVHVPHNKETENLLNEEAFGQMKEGVIVINTSRGDILNEPALYNAMKEGKVFAAGLDVYSQEPIGPAFPLMEFPNCVMTPHCASFTPAAFYSMLHSNVDTIEAFITGDNTIPQVN